MKNKLKILKSIHALCPACGKSSAFFEKARLSSGKQVRILKCQNPNCRRETR